MDERYQIRSIDYNALRQSGALELVWQVFRQFEAPEYSEEGIREFQEFIEPESFAYRMKEAGMLVWGSFDHDKIVGVAASRPPCHISLLFVDPDYHRRGIARELYNTVIRYYKNTGNQRVATVNSSPYAHEAYRCLGFVDTDEEQSVNGIRFIPMKHKFR